MSIKRTYAEAVDVMVEWWCDKSFHTANNQDNGDVSFTGFLAYSLGNKLANEIQKRTTPEQIQAFRDVLKYQLLKNESGSRYERGLVVDYDPCNMLYIACTNSGINTNCLPIKTCTFIESDNTIQGRYQYGGEWFVI